MGVTDPGPGEGPGGGGRQVGTGGGAGGVGRRLDAHERVPGSPGDAVEKLDETVVELRSRYDLFDEAPVSGSGGIDGEGGGQEGEGPAPARPGLGGVRCPP